MSINQTSYKIVMAPGGSAVDSARGARSGFNPSPIPPPPPKKKIFGLKQRKKKKQDELDAEAEVKRVWLHYLDHRDDMSVLGFAMGPDFRQGYVGAGGSGSRGAGGVGLGPGRDGGRVDYAEIVDFYQIICFLLRIPADPEHSGSWERIRGMLTVSPAAAPTPPLSSAAGLAAACLLLASVML